MFLGGKEVMRLGAAAVPSSSSWRVLWRVRAQNPIPEIEHTPPPKNRVQFEPIISCVRTYNGNDEDFTQALGEHFYVRDDTRFGR